MPSFYEHSWSRIFPYCAGTARAHLVGTSTGHKDDALKSYLDAQKIPMYPQKQYFDTYVLSRSGVAMKDNAEVKRKLGFANEQPFNKAMLDAVTRVASTADGDDCGEGWRKPSDWSRMFTQLGHASP